MISREEVEALARLARIQLGEGEVESLQKDISDILGYVETVSAIETSSIKGGGVVGEHRNVMRGDAVRAEGDPLAGREAALRAAFPKSENGFNVVRKIIQKDE